MGNEFGERIDRTDFSSGRISNQTGGMMELSRQRKRAALASFSWHRFSGENALRDTGGIILRSIRRDMMKQWRKREWKLRPR